MQKEGKCKHFNGIQHDQCLAGLNIRSVVGGDPFGWTKRMPCFKRNDTDIVCRQYSEPTVEEIADAEAEWQKSIDEITKVVPLCAELRKKHPGGGSGNVKCPSCGGTLHYAVAQCNGHVHGACETEGCLRWME
ncbi:MAG: hypothetical protein KZQ94_22755 [Candidatus Thiodiazotropha sp. (ex Troendleina suluensis)]|nr:hypothetical protein [Candidatus Thiodiazotropha sp. (ex Troendleina suluensis)]